MPNIIKIRDRITGETYDAFVQAVDINFNGHYVMRWNIGIQGHHEWHFICAVYDNDEFNKKYSVTKGE